MRATILAAGGLAVAGAAMTIAAFAGAGHDAAPQAAATRPHTANDGLQVWIANGCGSCHTFKPAGATGLLAPDLQQTLKGKDRSYVMQSIVAPDAAAAPGYSTGMMPDNFAKRIAPADLELLTDFILAGVHAR